MSAYSSCFAYHVAAQFSHSGDMLADIGLKYTGFDGGHLLHTIYAPTLDSDRDAFFDEMEAACVAIIEAIKTERMRVARSNEPTDEITAAISGRKYAYEHLK